MTLPTPVEEFRPIPGFPGYEASNLGRIQSRKQGAPRILRPSPDRGGYLRVTFWTASGRRSRRVHQCVADAFLGLREGRSEVRHLDGNQLNNCSWNLRWGSRSDNVRDSIAHGTFVQGRRCAEKTHCPYGHPYSPENTYVSPRGARGCRICRRRVNRELARARRAPQIG